jgi:predicted Na+-dependent transporter
MVTSPQVEGGCANTTMSINAFLDWCFRSRVTGRITIAQFPNTALWMFLAASLATWVVQPGGTLWGVARIIALGSGAYWAGDELLRGVNPWRRALGLIVLAHLVVSAAAYWS